MNKLKISLLVSILITFMSQAQSIEKFSIDSGGASVSTGTMQILYTIGEVNVAEHTSATVSVSEGFINADLKIIVDPKVFLQGPLLNPASAGLMNDILREDGVIPTTSPYEDGVEVDPSVFNVTGPDAIVDWVWVELRAANDNTKLINGKSALLQRDGDVVGLDGVSDLVMIAGPTNYYVVVKHRNHLGVMSNATIALNESTGTVVDFTNNSFTTFGTNAQTTFGMPAGVFALWAGDANGDGRLNYLGGFSENTSIRSQVFNDPNNSVFGAPPIPTYPSLGYYNTDVDLNNVTKYLGSSSDVLHIRNNTFNNPSNSIFGAPPVPTFVFTQQLPEGAND